MKKALIFRELAEIGQALGIPTSLKQAEAEGKRFYLLLEESHKTMWLVKVDRVDGSNTGFLDCPGVKDRMPAPIMYQMLQVLNRGIQLGRAKRNG